MASKWWDDHAELTVILEGDGWNRLSAEALSLFVSSQDRAEVEVRERSLTPGRQTSRKMPRSALSPRRELYKWDGIRSVVGAMEIQKQRTFLYVTVGQTLFCLCETLRSWRIMGIFLTSECRLYLPTHAVGPVGLGLRRHGNGTKG